LQPNLFNYSPKTNVNTIVDINNTGIKSFTFKDYIDLEGGYGSLMEESSTMSNLYASDFTKYLNNTDYNRNINKFGAFNVKHSFSDKTDVNAYVIVSDSDTHTRGSQLNEYTSQDDFLEKRRQNSTTENTFVLGKVTLDYQPSYTEDLKFNTTVKSSKNKLDGAIITENPSQNNTILNKSDISGMDLTQDVRYTRKLNKDHTGTLQANLNYYENDPRNNWLTNQEILQGILPLEKDTLYNISQNKKTQNLKFNGVVKDYWVINSSNHLYTTLGLNYEHNLFISSEYQLINQQERNDFSDAGFGNDITHDFSDVFMGIAYKFQRGIYTFKPALFYHFYNWQTYQLTNRNTHKGLLLPQFTFKADIGNSEKVNFSYKLNAKLPSTVQMASRNVLSNFNSVFKGNAMLQNSLYHSFSLSYYKFSLYKNLLLNAHINYNREERSLKNQTILNGIENYSTLVMFDNPENNLNIGGTIRKKINNLRYNFRASYYYNDF